MVKSVFLSLDLSREFGTTDTASSLKLCFLLASRTPLSWDIPPTLVGAPSQPPFMLPSFFSFFFFFQEVYQGSILGMFSSLFVLNPLEVLCNPTSYSEWQMHLYNCLLNIFIWLGLSNTTSKISPSSIFLNSVVKRSLFKK